MKKSTLTEIFDVSTIKTGKRSYRLLDRGYQFVNRQSGKFVKVNMLKPSETHNFLTSETNFLAKVQQTYQEFLASNPADLPRAGSFLLQLYTIAQRTRINIRVLKAKAKRTPYVAKPKKEKVVEATASETVQNALNTLNPEQSQH